MISRRSLLVGAATATACASTSPVAPRVPPSPRVAERPLERIFRLASLAPSRHNAQPWIVVARGDGTLRVVVDETRRVRPDPQGHESRLAVGAFVENLAVAARANGFAADIRIESDGAEIVLGRAPSAGDTRAVELRVTAAVPFERDALPREFGAIVATTDASFVPRDSAAGERLTRLALGATSDALAGEDDDFASWIRMDDDEARATCDGYTLASLGIDGVAASLLRLAGRGVLRSAAFRDRAVGRTRELLDASSGFLVLCANTPADDVVAGRIFERVALAARAISVAIHPLAAPVERGAIRAGDVGATGRVAVFARVGCLRSFPAPATWRRPPSAFVRSEPS